MFGMISPSSPPVGRDIPMAVEGPHYVHGTRLHPPFPAGLESVLFGMGCFWGAERRFWQQPGVYTTAVGYAGGQTPNPSYKEVCTGLTGHAEVVLVVFDPADGGFERLLALFWQEHDPTQGMRQGNDVGPQYRSVIYTTTPEQLDQALESRTRYQQALATAGRGPVTTEIGATPPFYYAETYHQQYLAKNPEGYCGLRGTGVAYPAHCR
jgi:peptide-methionine (S)-S-oxide reductase